MRLIGRDKLVNLTGHSSEIDAWVSAWVVEMSSSNWFAPTDLLKSFPKIIPSDDFVFIFPTCSNDYSVKVNLCFKRKLALIIEVIIND